MHQQVTESMRLISLHKAGEKIFFPPAFLSPAYCTDTLWICRNNQQQQKIKKDPSHRECIRVNRYFFLNGIFTGTFAGGPRSSVSLAMRASPSGSFLWSSDPYRAAHWQEWNWCHRVFLLRSPIEKIWNMVPGEFIVPDGFFHFSLFRSKETPAHQPFFVEACICLHHIRVFSTAGPHQEAQKSTSTIFPLREERVSGYRWCHSW